MYKIKKIKKKNSQFVSKREREPVGQTDAFFNVNALDVTQDVDMEWNIYK